MLRKAQKRNFMRVQEMRACSRNFFTCKSSRARYSNLASNTRVRVSSGIRKKANVAASQVSAAVTKKLLEGKPTH